MRRRLCAGALALCMLLTMAPMRTWATEQDPEGAEVQNLAEETETERQEEEDVPTSGTCGANVSWAIDGGTLKIWGNGEMYNYTPSGVSSNLAPWRGLHFDTVKIEAGITGIGVAAFQGCSSLSSITIPSSVRSMGDGAFAFCSSLSSITIPASVRRIGKNAFYDCNHLSSITISDGVTDIDDGAFQDCSSLSSITIPSSVRSMGDGAFAGCRSLSSITIPSSVTSIEDGAFAGCSSLSSVTILASVTDIGYSVFSGCSSLSSVTIPSSVTRIKESAFNECSSLTDVYYGGSESNWKSMYIEKNNEDLTDAAIHYNSAGSGSGGSSETNIVSVVIDRIKLIFQNAGRVVRAIIEVQVRCPVDVEVWTSGGQLAGSVKGSTADILMEDRVYIHVNNDEKYIYLLDDDTYTFRMVGTDNGTMTYSVQNIDIDTLETMGVKTYENVAIIPNKRFISSVNLEKGVVANIEKEGIRLYVMDNSGTPWKEVLADGSGTEVYVSHTVTFNANGGAVESATITTGPDGKLSGLPTPTRNGYTFDGWFTDVAGGERITADTVFTSDMTVYARWMRNSGSGSTTDNTGSSGNTPNIFNNNNTAAPGNAAAGQTKKSPQTGDTFSAVWLHMMGMSITTFLICGAVQRKRRREQNGHA